MNARKISRLAAAVAMALPLYATAGTAQIISPEADGALDTAAKTKLIRLPGGTLVSTFSYGNADDNETVYDPKAQAERPARDIFVTVSTDDGANWSTPVNISDTAAYSSKSTYWELDSEGELLTTASPFYGDSGKPNIYNAGSVIMITWVDKYCPTETTGVVPNAEQGAISYATREGRQLPYSCTYAAFTKTDPSVKANWTVKQLTYGERDAMQDSSRGITVKDSSGATTGVAWAVTWQEDPAGLQPGSADGPGDGVSGAIVSKGTDIWYTYVDDLRATTAADDLESNIGRLTQNFQKYQQKEGSDVLVPLTNNPMESGYEGASRPNLAMVQVSESGVSKYQTIIAYEETKGSGSEIDFGKVVRYHAFDYDTPPTSGVADGTTGELIPDVTDTDRIGCVISDPAKNGRRVRFFANTNNSSVGDSGAKITFLWKEGAYDQGGPSDIMSRVGYISADDTASTGIRPADLSPAVDTGCAYSLSETDRENLETLADNIDNTVGINLSHEADEATGSSYSVASLQIDTEDNTLEDARAHRGAIRGDTIFLGYTYTPDAALAKYTDMENYNFYVRRSFDGGVTWTSAENLSNIDDTTVTVKEPRIVAMPGSESTCTAGETWETNDTCQNPDAYIVAWGTQSNVYDQLGGAVDLDLYVTGTLDSGDSYLPLALLAGNPTDLNNPEDDEEAESQLRANPAGTALYAVYNGTEVDPADDTITDGLSWFISGSALNLDEENREGIISYSNSADLDSDHGGALGFLSFGLLGLLGFATRRRKH